MSPKPTDPVPAYEELFEQRPENTRTGVRTSTRHPRQFISYLTNKSTKKQVTLTSNNHFISSVLPDPNNRSRPNPKLKNRPRKPTPHPPTFRSNTILRFRARPSKSRSFPLWNVWFTAGKTWKERGGTSYLQDCFSDFCGFWCDVYCYLYFRVTGPCDFFAQKEGIGWLV